MAPNAQKTLWQRFRRIRAGHLYGLCLLWAGLLLWAQFSSFAPLIRQELTSLDQRFEWRGAIPAAPEIVIVSIDERSINMFDEEHLQQEPNLGLLRSYPFPRSAYAAALRRLFDAGARVVAIDLLFLSAREDDEELRATIEKYPDRIVIGSNFSDDGRQLLLPSAVVPDSVPTEEVAGYVNVWGDTDGFVRWARLETSFAETGGVPGRSGEERLLSFDALALKKYNPQTTWEQPGFYINFPGPPGSFAAYPFYQLFYDRAWNENLRGGEVFRDKIVVIGPGANFQHDTSLTPFATGSPAEMPGVEIHAATIATALHGTAPQDASHWVAALTVLALAVITAVLLNTRFHPLLKICLLIALCLAYVGLAAWLFSHRGLVVLLATPLWTVGGGGLIGIVLQLVAERLEKHRMRQTLERFVSHQVAAEILRHNEEYEHSLGGERKPVSILFSDIRGFTPLSESMSPLELVALLNEYLTAMVEVVMKHDGTLDKFIGDAIMAVYGAPISAGPSEDAWRSVQTAYEMRSRLELLQRDWTKRGIPPLQIGIGINHGEAVVGYIGSPQRMEYTVIGDAVNVASRVEGLNKEYGTDILLTESVHELVKDRVQARLIGAASVKGRAQQLRVYALESLAPSTTAYVDGSVTALNVGR